MSCNISLSQYIARVNTSLVYSLHTLRPEAQSGARVAFFIFRNVRCFVLYNIGDFTPRREKSLCRIAATPNHYVRSALQCSREVSKSEKEDPNVLEECPKVKKNLLRFFEM